MQEKHDCDLRFSFISKVTKSKSVYSVWFYITHVHTNELLCFNTNGKVTTILTYCNASAHHAGKSKQQERAQIPTEPPQFSVSGQGRRNLAAENYCLWILWYLQSAVQNPITSKHTSQFQLSEVLVEAGVWLETRVSLFQEVKSHLKGATCEPFISLHWTLH